MKGSFSVPGMLQEDSAKRRLVALKDQVESTEALIEVDLDHRRNKLVCFKLLRSAFLQPYSCILGVVSLLAPQCLTMRVIYADLAGTVLCCQAFVPIVQHIWDCRDLLGTSDGVQGSMQHSSIMSCPRKLQLLDKPLLSCLMNG